MHCATEVTPRDTVTDDFHFYSRVQRAELSTTAIEQLLLFQMQNLILILC